MPRPPRARHRDFSTDVRYVVTVLRGFRWTFSAIVVAVLVGGALIRFTPEAALGGNHPPWILAFYGAWMSMFAQPLFSPPDTWYLAAMGAFYPLFGVVLIGEGLVRFALLMVSRRRGEKEWMLVMASTYRNHVVICGIGHLGYRVLKELVEQGRQVVAIEKDPTCRFLEEAKEVGAAVLIRDIKDDEALIQAGVPHAQSIIIATDDDMANLEVALDARRMNPAIRTAVRMFDQAMASKLKDAFKFDFAFSASALAAPTVAAMSMPVRVISAFSVGGQPQVVAEVDVGGHGRFTGHVVADVERSTRLRILGRTDSQGQTESPPAGTRALVGGDLLVVAGPNDALQRCAADFSRGASDRS